MLRQVAEGVLVHESEFVQSNAIVVQGRAGVLLIDPGVQDHEMACLANDLSRFGPDRCGRLLDASGLGSPALARPARRGPSLRHGPLRGRCPGSAVRPGCEGRASPPTWTETEIAEQVPLDLYGLITALPAETAQIPWDGPQVRIIEHQAHAPGHAALFIEERGVLVAGDMLSDVLIPMLDLNGTADPIEDYLAALRLLEGVAGDVDVVVPGHGSVGGADQVHARIERDRAYVLALRDGHVPSDPRIGPSAKPGWEWVSDVHNGQAPAPRRKKRARRDAPLALAGATTPESGRGHASRLG